MKLGIEGDIGTSERSGPNEKLRFMRGLMVDRSSLTNLIDHVFNSLGGMEMDFMRS
jgi:hypothetical protein